MWLIDLPKKAIKMLFTSRVTVKKPPHSELSSPLVNMRKRNPGRLTVKPVHKVILKEISEKGWITANSLARSSSVSSADKRINELFHLGYADVSKNLIPGVGVKFHYTISEEGKKLIM